MALTPETVTLIVAILAIFASGGFWQYILYKVQKRDNTWSIRTEADKVLLHDAVYKNCHKAILRGYTTLTEFDNVTCLYDVYKKLGGNGTAQRIYEKVCMLPIHDEDAAREVSLNETLDDNN